MVTFQELFQRDYGSAKIGVFGCGCWFYWDQFEGLKERLLEHQRVFTDRLRQNGVNVVIVLVGHDGPHHIGVAQGRPVLRSLSVFHGKRGAGVGVEFKIRHGPITCVALTQTYGGKFRLVVAEGESLPGPIPPTGNTNTRCRFPPNLRAFIENWSLAGPTHHFALGVGHLAGSIEKLARCWGIEFVNVTDPAYRRPQFIR